ncbi:MAG: M55 family metallopeptidase, partial [Candidatus Thorarchaeota archaeon]
QVFPASSQYQIYITEETNAAIRGFKRGGIEEVYVIDGHGYDASPNIRPELLDQTAQLTTKEEMLKRDRKNLRKEIGTKVNASVLLGCHARRQAKGFMSHTKMHYPPVRIWINGIEVGEIYLYVLWASNHNISTILFTGDDIAMEEAESLMPDAEHIVTKRSLSRNRCTLVPLETVRLYVEDAAFRATKRFAEIKPFQLPNEYKVEITFNSREHAFACQNIPNAELKNGSIVACVTKSYDEAISFIDASINIAKYYESHELVSALTKMGNISETILEWKKQRCNMMGASWDSD